MQEFFSMGGYGMYVWPSYGLSAVILVGMMFIAISKLKATRASFEKLKSEAEATNGDEA